MFSPKKGKGKVCKGGDKLAPFGCNSILQTGPWMLQEAGLVLIGRKLSEPEIDL